MSEVFNQSRLLHQFDALLHLTKEQEDGRKAPPPPPVELDTDNDDSEVEEGWDLCMVCKLDRDHGSGDCPYRRSLPDGAKLGPGWKPACCMCGADEFDVELKSCIKCDSESKCAVPITCSWCLDWGHEFEDCPDKDNFDSTDFLHPDP